MPRKHLVVPVFAGLTLLTGCGAAAGPPPTRIEPAAQEQRTQQVSVNAAGVAGLGTVLTDQNGRTLYLFTDDGTSPPESRCVDECTETWPPLLALGDVRAAGVAPDQIGEFTRPDGTEQVTIGDRPVYLYSGDRGPGQANGQGLQDKWFAVTPEGEQSGAPDQIALVATDIPDFGSALTDQDGRTLYLFTEDSTTPPASRCVDECAEKWPPLLTTGGDIELTGVDPDLVGTVTRPDGTKQVTVGNWPVYTYVEDSAPGQTNGHGVGGVWFVIEEEGCKSTAPVRSESSGRSKESSEEADADTGY